MSLLIFIKLLKELSQLFNILWTMIAKIFNLGYTITTTMLSCFRKLYKLSNKIKLKTVVSKLKAFGTILLIPVTIAILF